MDRIVPSLIFAVPYAVVFTLVRGVLDDHLLWPVALAIAIVPGLLTGFAAYYLYTRIAKKPWRWWGT